MIKFTSTKERTDEDIRINCFWIVRYYRYEWFSFFLGLVYNLLLIKPKAERDLEVGSPKDWTQMWGELR